MLFLSDVHRPYHSEQAWRLLMKVGRKLKPKHIVVNGDFLDCYCVSNHSKDPSRVDDLKWEIDDGKKGLRELESLGAPNLYWLDGNHEFRLARYLKDKAPQLFNVVDIPRLLELREHGWRYIPYRDETRIGKLYLTHDVGSAGRYSTYKALDTYQHSIVTGHAHRISYVVEGNAVGEYKLAAQFGWLGDVNKVDYMHRASAKKNWALGFGVGYLDPSTGYTYLTPVPIVRGTCMVNGELFR
jgi:predicted phosphodiesterase